MNPSRRPRAPGVAPDDEYAELVRAVHSGSRQALENLLMRAQEVAWRFSLLVCGGADEAEDAMQEALLKTYRYAARIREPGAFRTWLYRTVKNACPIRRRRRVDEPARLLSLDDLLPAPGEAGAPREREPADRARRPDELAMNAYLRRRLRRAMAKLPRQYRTILFLREVEGLSTREVAALWGFRKRT